MGYSFGNHKIAMAEIKELHKRQHPDTSGMDEEETREIIMERITINERKRAQYPPEMEYEIVESGTETEDEDEDE